LLAALTGPAAAASAISRLSYLVFGTDAPWYVALEKGWYEEAGLDIKIHPGRARPGS
jgi:ABC-type nitrate/sulfonate/bicarbonate transport system substrate-binding protein